MIPAEAVEAAARASHASRWPNAPWDALNDDARTYACKNARLTLEAAAPLMLQDLRKLVEDMEAQPWTETGTIRGMAALIRSSARGLL